MVTCKSYFNLYEFLQIHFSCCVAQLPPRTTPTTPQELAVVVDSMLQGLGKQLRSCGVDVRILENYEDHEKAIEVGINTKLLLGRNGRKEGQDG